MRFGSLLVAFLAVVALAAGCGGDDDSKTSGSSSGTSGGDNVFAGEGKCKGDVEAGLEKAAREHPGPLKVAEDGGGEGEAGSVDRIDVDICQTDDENATAVVVVYGLRDDSVRDVRHEMRLIKSGGIWQVTDDQDSRRCQKGRGQQTFEGTNCQ
ncbi:MAG: hypothetical protein ACRDKY_13150 [Solirubrobacteraceae bacterium]